jgi:hypothetical protein
MAKRLSALLRYTDSDYPFGILWPLCCLLFFVTRILITPLVSFGHCVVCSSSLHGFWLTLWYLLATVLSAPLRYTDSDYPFGIFWPLCCLLFFVTQILITPLVSFGHCVVCSSSLHGFWLPLWYLLAIVLSAYNTMAKRYQRVNQNPCNEEEQTTQWPKDTKGIIRIRVTKKRRQHNG